MGLREIRRTKNITQQQLGDAIGVNNSIISKYEKGLVVPPADKLARLAEVLQVSVKDIIEPSFEERNTHYDKNKSAEKRDIATYHGDSDAGSVNSVGSSDETVLSAIPNEPEWDKVDLKVLVAALSLANPPISQAKLAKRLNISPVTLSRIVTGKDCSVRKEWIPILTEYLLSIDFSTINSSMNALNAISVRAKSEKVINDAILFLQKCSPIIEEAYIFDDNYWGTIHGIIRFYDEVKGRQWLFTLGDDKNHAIWRLSRTGAGPFRTFSRIRSSISANDKVSILYFNQRDFNESVKKSSDLYQLGMSKDTFHRPDLKITCCQSFVLGNKEMQSIEAEYILTDSEGEPLDCVY